ncbi:MAG TPA: rhomboid family intramembrane serine protease [Candidatus Dormibacteraeota bacterium]|nr:rhomboid family intramembrane serine protease [Candidatus Dormibacteraeota bacterium]
MFLPLRHDSMEGRRWPVISIALVVLNLLVFLGTHNQIDQEGPERGEIRSHIRMLAADHPELTIPPVGQEIVDQFAKDNPAAWAAAKSGTRDIQDAWDAKMRLIDDPAKLQAEMDSLCSQYASFTSESILYKYAFIPAHPSAISYLTANFLHSGWLHLIGNMWFLWLAGVLLEDTWGRIIYPIFYWVAGIAALQFYAWTSPGSLVPALGASGAVAALMGAFLVRFPTTKIDVAVILGPRSIANLAIGKGFRFKAAAYWLLPFWLLAEIFSGTIFGRYSSTAHWAHVGGFIFGGLAALALRHSGLEAKADAAIESKVTWTADAGIVTATDQLHQGKLDDAIASLQNYLSANPESTEGYTLLHQAYWRKNDVPAYRDAISKLIQLHLKSQNFDAAWQDYADLKNSGSNLPSATWLELGRAAETQGNLERAVEEYGRLAAAFPNERPALLALLSAGRLSLKNLKRPADALRYYETASKSPVPHADWETNIRNGIEGAKKALAPVPA